jgi:hypothetical protein
MEDWRDYDRGALTISVYGPAHMIEKIRWNYAQFESAQASREFEPTTYAMIDLAVAITSLADWIAVELNSVRAASRVTLDKVKADIADFVPEWQLVRGISNTAKHAHYLVRGVDPFRMSWRATYGHRAWDAYRRGEIDQKALDATLHDHHIHMELGDEFRRADEMFLAAIERLVEFGRSRGIDMGPQYALPRA